MWPLTHKETTKAQGETAQESQQKVLELFPSSLRADIWIHSVPYVVPVLLPSRTFQDLSVLPLWFVIILWFSPLYNSLSIWTVLHSALGIIFYFSTLKKVTCSESLWCTYRHSMRWFTCWDPKTGRLTHKVPQRDRAARRAAGRNAEGGLPRSCRSHGLWCFFRRSCAWIQRSLVPVLAVSGSSSVTLDFSLPLTLLTGNIIKLKIPLGLKLFIMTLQMLWFNSLLMTPHSIAIWGLSMRHEIID